MPIDKAQFTFTPPAGAAIKDLRAGEVNKQVLLQKLTQQLLDVAAKALGMTTDQLKAELAKGTTIATLAKTRGINEADLKAAVINAIKPALDQLVQSGQLAQQDEDSFIQTIQNTDLSKPTSLDSFGVSNATHVPILTPLPMRTNSATP
jgi:hypothetical protein